MPLVPELIPVQRGGSASDCEIPGLLHSVNGRVDGVHHAYGHGHAIAHQLNQFVVED